jgi:DNA-nicking Smr family endonuclease
MSGGSRSFQIGEEVSFLYESGKGIVRSFLPNGLLKVEDSDGFERSFRPDELAKIYSSDYKLPDDAVTQINEDDSISREHYTIRKETKTGSRKPIDIWEIDLHIESLLDSHAGMSNAEILNHQLRELRTFYQKARSKYIRRIIIIHGVGEGVLKEEVRFFLSKKDGVEFYDADFREYGKGATAVDLFYNF